MELENLSFFLSFYFLRWKNLKGGLTPEHFSASYQLPVSDFGCQEPFFFFFLNKNLLTACVPRKPLPQFPTSLMAPELGETQGTAPRAKYSGNGKERGPEDGERGWAGQRKCIHRLVGTHLDAWLWKSSRLLTWAADRPCSQMCEALNVKCPANQGKRLCWCPNLMKAALSTQSS